MNKKGGFFGILVAVFEDPVYLIFTVLLIIYAFTGSLSGAALILLSLIFSTCIRAYFSFHSVSSVLKADFSNRGKIKKTQGTITGGFSKLSSVLSFIVAAAAVPLLIFELVRPDKSDFSSAFSNILSLMALGLAIPGAQDGSCMDYAVSRMFRGRDGEQKGIEIRNADACECIASCDTAMILQPTVFYDKTTEVRELWYSASVYRESGLLESGLGMPAQKSAALSMILQNVNTEGFLLKTSYEDALLKFNDYQSEGRFNCFSSCTFGDPFLNFPGTGDVSVLLRYKTVPVHSEVLIRSVSPDILSRCSYFRQNDGSTAELSDRHFSELLESVSSMTDKGLTPYFIVTASSDILTDLNCGDFILEAIPAVGGTFSEGNADAVAALEDFGVRPVLCLPADNRTARNFAVECGISGGSDAVVSFEEFSNEPAGSPIEKSHSVFVGFSAQAVSVLARRLRRTGSLITAVVRKQSDMPVMNDSIASCAVRESKDDAICNLCDCVIPASGTEDKDGGISGLFSLFTLSVSVCSRLFMIRNMLLSYMAILVFAVVFPMIANADSLRLSAVNVLLCGAFFSLALVWVMPEEDLYMQSRTGFESFASREKLNILKYSGMGLLSAAAIAVCGVLFFSDSFVPGQCFINSALLLSGPAVILSERFSEKNRLGAHGINLIFIIYSLLTVILAMGICFSGVSFLSGAEISGTQVPAAFRTLLISFVPSLVPLAFSGISFLISKSS